MEVNHTGRVAQEIAKREGGMSEGQRKGGRRGTEGGTALGGWKEQTFAFSAWSVEGQRGLLGEAL